ncbi:MAG: UDP-N-acetylglucosamine 1-carboxyvinyltransferase [Clostridia bacterium]|nr:UDP-N-acetylglucosamine 1-carboxyvinyltransferase [Clostridia bacterium]
MNKIVVEGGVPISGEITVQGAKNAVLPILAATVLTDSCSIIHNCPRLRDVEKTVQILTDLGCNIKRCGGDIEVDASGMKDCGIDERLMREMRSSIIFLGAILSRCGAAEVGMPGGCPIGLRPIDLHLKALRKMGASICEDHGYLKCECSRLKGCSIHLDFPSVGATENVMLAAVRADGETHITNAAREPEIIDLAGFLNKMGARIRGAGSSMVTIEGVPLLHGAEYAVMPDRIVAETYLIAAMMTGGELVLRAAVPSHMQAVISALAEMGGRIEKSHSGLCIKCHRRPGSIHIIKTMPYPGFPTDAQSPFMALASIADGTSVFVENIFENRFRHVDELVRMGADIKVEGRSAVVRGVRSLCGANVCAEELRGGAALVLAAMAAEGRTEITGTEFIDRGYEDIEGTLSRCGIKIKRVIN